MNDLNRHLDAASGRGERTAMRAIQLMRDSGYSHDNVDNLLEALANMSAHDADFLADAIPIGSESLGNAALAISYGYWLDKVHEEAERQIAAEYDSCTSCNGIGCKHCNN